MVGVGDYLNLPLPAILAARTWLSTINHCGIMWRRCVRGCDAYLKIVLA